MTAGEDDILDLITPLLKEAQELRDAVPSLLTHTSPEFVEQEMLKREDFKMRVREVLAKLGNRVAELESWKGALNIARGYQTNDVKKLDSLKWELIRSRPKQ